MFDAPRRLANPCWMMCQKNPSSSPSLFKAIDVARGGQRGPVDSGMVRLEILWQPTRCFRSDLQCARNGKHYLPVAREIFQFHSGRESRDYVDILDDVSQPLRGS
jgi:hypothetical protein